MLVVDAGVAVAASNGETSIEELQDADLVAPPLMWSEALSTLHLGASRGAISQESAEQAREALEELAIKRVDSSDLRRQAWSVADELGWGRTYDAEYVALARLLECRVVTLDMRLRRGADRLGLVTTPMELLR